MSVRESANIEPQPSGWRAATVSLQNANFRWLYGSNAAFFFAMNGQMVVRSYLAFKLTDSATALGLVNLAVALPMLLLSPIGGVVADRFERRKLVMIGQALLVVNEVTVLALLMAGVLEFWHLVGVVVVMGAIFPFIMPARQAMTVEIVGRRDMANAMALMMGSMNAARVVSPALAGFIIYLAGVEWTYAVAVAVYAIALFCMTRVPASKGAPIPGKSVFRDLADGLRFAAHEPTVRGLMLLSIVPMLLSMPFQTLLVVFTEEVWNTGSRGLGILQAAAGLGGVLGSVYIAWQGNSRHVLRIMISSLMGFTAMLFLFAISPLFLLALPFVLLADVFVAIFNTSNGAAVQMLVPDHMRGRVMSLFMMTFGLTPLGAVPVAAAADAWGAPTAVAGASVVTAVASLAIIFFSRALRRVDATVLAARDEDDQSHFERVAAGQSARGRTPLAEAKSQG